MRHLTLFVASFAFVVPVFAQPGPAVDVSFPRTGHYIDAGDGPREAEANQAALSKHLQSLGSRWLAPGQKLQIEVKELDLAGQWQITARRPQGLRVLNGAADWPRIDLHYVLSEEAGVVKEGDESLADSTYLQKPLSASGGDTLRYEKRLLTQWFRQHFDKTAKH